MIVLFFQVALAEGVPRSGWPRSTEEPGRPADVKRMPAHCRSQELHSRHRLQRATLAKLEAGAVLQRNLKRTSQHPNDLVKRSNHFRSPQCPQSLVSRSSAPNYPPKAQRSLGLLAEDDLRLEVEARLSWRLAHGLARLSVSSFLGPCAKRSGKALSFGSCPSVCHRRRPRLARALTTAGFAHALGIQGGAPKEAGSRPTSPSKKPEASFRLAGSVARPAGDHPVALACRTRWPSSASGAVVGELVVPSPLPLPFQIKSSGPQVMFS